MSDETKKSFSIEQVPWQIWLVVAMLSLEGIGNLMEIPSNLTAASWLVAKVLFIVGLLRRWKWVYVICIAVAALHVYYFAMAGMFFVSFLNLTLLILTLCALRYYFPKETDDSIDKRAVV